MKPKTKKKTGKRVQAKKRDQFTKKVGGGKQNPRVWNQPRRQKRGDPRGWIGWGEPGTGGDCRLQGRNKNTYERSRSTGKNSHDVDPERRVGSIRRIGMWGGGGGNRAGVEGGKRKGGGRGVWRGGCGRCGGGRTNGVGGEGGGGWGRGLKEEWGGEKGGGVRG